MTPEGVAAWTLRPAGAADLERARALVGACELPLQGVEDQFGDRYVLAERDGTLIGVAGVEVFGAYGLLRSVAVARDARSAGVGADLVRDRLEWSRRQGLTALYLLTQTAEHFFAKRGFVVVDRGSAPAGIRASSEFSRACPESARLMRRELGAAR
jgi:amino-acid N-acetyltransferase